MSLEVFDSPSFAEVYSQVAHDTLFVPHSHPTSRGEKMLEMRDVVLKFSADTIPLIKNKVRSASPKYLAGEFIWYYSGSNSLDFIDHYSKFWKGIANSNRTCNSAYGALIFRQPNPTCGSQYYYAYKTLISDRESRRAYIHFAKPEFQHIHSKDIPCTLTATFHIRDDLLHLAINMRSSDLYFGLVYDVPFFVSLLQQMRQHLLPAYKYLLLGNVTMFLNSVHIYRKQAELFKNMLRYPIESIEVPWIKEDLISQQGAPTQNIMRLYNDARVYTQDPLLTWLQKHSVTNTMEDSH